MKRCRGKEKQGVGYFKNLGNILPKKATFFGGLLTTLAEVVRGGGEMIFFSATQYRVYRTKRKDRSHFKNVNQYKIHTSTRITI